MIPQIGRQGEVEAGTDGATADDLVAGVRQRPRYRTRQRIAPLRGGERDGCDAVRPGWIAAHPAGWAPRVRRAWGGGRLSRVVAELLGVGEQTRWRDYARRRNG